MSEIHKLRDSLLKAISDARAMGLEVTCDERALKSIAVSETAKSARTNAPAPVAAEKPDDVAEESAPESAPVKIRLFGKKED